MLKLIIGDEGFDQDKNIFVITDATTIELEHSLAALSKWESIHKKPFLSSDKSSDELTEYVSLMCLTPNTPPEVFLKLSEDNIASINEYINDSMTATWFNEKPDGRPSQKIVTAELIYYWMVTLQVPFECQYWHLNKLLTLIRVINLENAPKRKMGRAEAARYQRALNAQRQAQRGTSG